MQRRESVQGSIVQGDDLIAILRESTFDPRVKITIVNSVIEGGLDFTTLPATAVEQVKWPKSGSDEERDRWIARKRSAGFDEIYAVANPISITASTILPRPQNGESAGSVAVKASTTLIEQMIFQDTTFAGEAQFGDATFTGLGVFKGTTFAGTAQFGGATFSQGAGFGGATFAGGAGFGGARSGA